MAQTPGQTPQEGAGAQGGAQQQNPPSLKLDLLRLLLEAGAEVRTLYKHRLITALEDDGSHVVVRYADGGVDRIHIRDFGRRRFVVVL